MILVPVSSSWKISGIRTSGPSGKAPGKPGARAVTSAAPAGSRRNVATPLGDVVSCHFTPEVETLIRGKSVNQALATLQFTRKTIARELAKVLRSAVANLQQREGWAIFFAVAFAHHEVASVEASLAALAQKFQSYSISTDSAARQSKGLREQSRVLTAALVAFGSFFNPALSAAVPNLVKREQLLTANALTNALWGFMLAAGAMVGGLTIALVGRDLAFVVNSLSFFFSAVMLWSIRKPFAQSHHGANRSLNPFADFREGLSYAWKRPQVMALLTVKTGGGLAGGVILLLTVFGVKVFNSGAFGIGLLQAARGTGILLGPLIVRAVASSEIGRIQKLIAAGFFVTGIAYALFSFSPALGGNLVLWQTTSTSGSNAQVFNLSLALVIALIAVFVAHNGWGSNWTSSSTLLQQLTPDRIRGRIFSMDFGMVTLAIAFSTFLTGAAVERFDPQTIALALGAVFVLYGAVWSIAVWWSQRTRPDEWRVGSLHHVAANLEEAPVTTGE